LVGQVASAEGGLETLADLFSRDGLEVGGGEDTVDDLSEARKLVGRDCDARE